GLRRPPGACCCSREPQARRPSETASTRNDGLDERRARVSRLAETRQGIEGQRQDPEIKRIRAKTIKRVQDDLENMQFNTAVAALMEGLNGLSKHEPDAETLADFCILLSPFAPHIANELYEQLTAASSADGAPLRLDDAEFPTYDETDLAEDEVEVVIQVNGKVRSRIKIPADDLNEATLLSISQSDAKVKSFIGSTPVKKTIVVLKNRLVNVVV
ncbi:class I tRNA ligase family protein, partial [Candidatus Saccharibacteria bacterium]|nr:class I tRNA ligase family protein [Candidatus Saccharibacteria bacterium]